uniref:Uncharacterized protein n=1 Tax=Anopheles minimus TaxID=112268 RepID=A0A182WJ07_9DIPT
MKHRNDMEIEIQRALTHWIKPLHKVSVNQSRSAPLSTTFFTHEADNASQMPYWQYQDNYQHHHQHHDHHDHQQQQREGFVVSYDPEKDFKDPWEDYLQRQEREKVLRKQEEERLYFQYLNELRAQEHRSRTQYESSLASHHDQSPYHVPHHDAPNAQHHQDRPGADGGYTERDHHHNHHDNNAFQRTEQWVDRMVQQHQENVGHWEKQSGQVFAAVQHQDAASYSPVVHHTTGGEQMSNRTVVHDSNNNFTTAGDGNANVSHKSTQIQEHETVPPSFSQQEPSNQRQPTGSEESNAAGGNVGDVTGLAGALAQLHLGEAKSKEQEAYEEHMRRQCWETGNIDYMGRDSFENIWKRIQQTLNTGTGSGAEEKESATVQTVSPAVTQRTSRRPSRSRSATPKRDPKDRSPTPQPEEKIPVDKKEVHHVVPPPVIAEEDDVAIRLSSIESAVAMRTQAKLPPPIQYDPTTNTTTLTKKVFAGYRQIITTKNPEGKTRTHEKLVYDPSIDDDQPATVVDATQLSVKQNVGGEVGTTSTATTTTTTVPIARAALSQKQSEMPSATVPSAVERQLPSSVPAETSAYQPTIPKSPPKHVPAPVVQPTQQQQQVAQESIAGKTNALQDTKQPVKALRKKRHISPQSRPQQTTTNAASTDQVPGKPSTPSPSPRSSSLTSASRNDQQEKASVASAIISPSVSSSMAKTITTPSPLADAQVASVLTPTARDKTLTAVQQQTLPLNIPSGQTKPNNQPVEGVKVGSPPVPPRRKRESRATKLGKI